MKQFEVISVNISEKVGVVKKPIPAIQLKVDHGVIGDAHAKNWHRQVSLLATEDIDIMRKKFETLKPGDFAENITTKGIELFTLPIGTKLSIGEVELEVTQIGKKCHKGCAILKQVGDCIMPRRGIFTKVIKGGEINNESTGTYDI